jgi:acyl-CoA thioester hydrolase
MLTIQELTKGYPVLLELPVVWGEMDAAQHVNNTVYLRYSETARVDFFHHLGFEVSVNSKEQPVGPILAEINCRYKAPLTYPDTITVASRVNLDTLDEYSFWVEQVIISHQMMRVAAEVKARLVGYDYTLLKKAPLPNYFVQKIEEMSENFRSGKD